MSRNGTQTQTTTVNPPFDLAPQVQDYISTSLSGGFFGQNPYVDDLVNRSSRSIINQVQSNFATSGRNARGIDPAGVATDRLVDLNAMLRGPIYEAERQRQQNTLANLIGPSTTTSIPTQSNVLGSALGGAGLAQLLIPSDSNWSKWAGLIGGGLGGLLG